MRKCSSFSFVRCPPPKFFHPNTKWLKSFLVPGQGKKHILSLLPLQQGSLPKNKGTSGNNFLRRSCHRGLKTCSSSKTSLSSKKKWTPKIFAPNFPKSENGWKIARITPIWTKIWSKRSQWWELDFFLFCWSVLGQKTCKKFTPSFAKLIRENFAKPSSTRHRRRRRRRPRLRRCHLHLGEFLLRSCPDAAQTTGQRWLRSRHIFCFHRTIFVKA